MGVTAFSICSGIACWHLIPAIRAGNTVVIKPSPLTPLSTIRLDEVMNEVLPAGVVNVVTGETKIGAQLSARSGIRTGSSHLAKPCTLLRNLS